MIVDEVTSFAAQAQMKEVKLFSLRAQKVDAQIGANKIGIG